MGYTIYNNIQDYIVDLKQYQKENLADEESWYPLRCRGCENPPTFASDACGDVYCDDCTKAIKSYVRKWNIDDDES